VPLQAKKVTSEIRVLGGRATLAFDPAKHGGFPHEILLSEGHGTAHAKQLRDFAWNDRVHHPQRGSWLLRWDRNPDVRILMASAAATVIRVHGRYCDPQGRPEPGGAEAVYDWYVFKQSPLVLVRTFVRQRVQREWPELHQLEFNVADDRFSDWLGGQPLSRGTFEATKRGWVVGRWGALVSKPDAASSPVDVVGMIGPLLRFYDGRGEYGTYLHGPWELWNGSPTAFDTWLWLGASRAPDSDLQTATRSARLHVAALTNAALEKDLARLERTAAARWLASVARQLAGLGRLDMAERLTGQQRSGGEIDSQAPLAMEASSGLGLALQAERGGIRLLSLYDCKTGRELAAADSPPLFRILLRNANDGSEAAVVADRGWERVEILRIPTRHRQKASPEPPHSLRLVFSHPADRRLAGVGVTVIATPGVAIASWEWTIRVDNGSKEWGIEKVAFPQIKLHPLGEETAVFYPTNAGVVRLLSENPSLRYESLYPNGWCTMQYMAAYGQGTGLYFGFHDPNASSKYLVQSGQQGGGVTMAFDVPVPDMGQPGTRFVSPGKAVWQLLHGDWYDAAQIYRKWVRKEARWFPRLGKGGRTDTAEWMKRLCAWAQTGGTPAECVEPVKAMQKTLGVPIGFHWYNWHQIPFDNDYPHYFPTKEGVAAAVADLQSHDVYVMPYINGRLWDTRDRGSEDFEFTARALPAATKQRSGEPYVETYGSKEADGSPVRLAVMCPTSKLWQQTVGSIVHRLMTEVGTKAVYIDQIAAAPPVLCMDPAHGHPLGGGSWWTVDGYWPLLRGIREQMPRDRMITSECAAEAYAFVLDGLLSWDWQADGMVPALPAVYGGAIQYFGRNYSAGATTRDLALCAKMGQQLVFGEQIGWLDPRISQEPVAGAFLRLIVRTRHRFVEYFAAGEMMRPPRLEGNVPTVRSDWAWYGETWVTTPAVQTGAWKLPGEKRLILIFVNTSDQRVKTAARWHPPTYGVPQKGVRCWLTKHPATEAVAVEAPPSGSRITLDLPARSLEVWEFRW